MKSVSPADGATITQADSITLEVKTDDVASMARIEIATQPNLGQDGTLAAEFTLPGFGFVLVTRGDAFPDTYTATINSYGIPGYGLTPGTYYWQMSYSKYETMPAPVYGQSNTYTTPVFKLIVSAPAPPAVTPAPAPSTPPAPSGGWGTTPTMSLSQANGYTRDIIRQETGRSAYNLKRSCRRVHDASFACEISWLNTRRLRSSTTIYAGTLTLTDPGGDSITYRFRGLRATKSCIDRKSVKRCARNVTW